MGQIILAMDSFTKEPCAKGFAHSHVEFVEITYFRDNLKYFSDKNR